MVIQIMRDLNLVYQKPNGIRLIVGFGNKIEFVDAYRSKTKPIDFNNNYHPL